MGRVSDAKDRLLDAAIKLVWRNSYGAVSVEDICHEAGVKKGSFYHFFPGKNELVAAAFRQYWVDLRPELDEGTRILLDALQVFPTDEALDIGCGAGYLGLHIARQASRGSVTMVDVSLAAVAVALRQVAESGLTNIRVLPSDGARAVLSQRFDLVVTNPPFHHGGIQTMQTAERFIREAAYVLRSPGRFYLVANRFLKYEPVLRTHFKTVEEVGGNTRYKVIRAVR